MKGKKPHPMHWKPGESGNPRGRKPGSKNKPKMINEEVALVASQMAASRMTGEQMLEMSAPKIVASMIALALHCEDPRLKFKALTECFSRIIPVLRVQDLRYDEFRRAHELSDRELVGLGMALQEGRQYPGKVGRGNGGESILIEGSTNQGEPG